MLPLAGGNALSVFVGNPQLAPRGCSAVGSTGRRDNSRSRTGVRDGELFAGQARVRQPGECESPDRNEDGPSKAANEFFPLHRKDPKALPQYAEFEASNWTRNDIGVMFWTVAGDICERRCQRGQKWTMRGEREMELRDQRPL